MKSLLEPFERRKSNVMTWLLSEDGSSLGEQAMSLMKSYMRFERDIRGIRDLRDVLVADLSNHEGMPRG